jgi:hypothetical protein
MHPLQRALVEPGCQFPAQNLLHLLLLSCLIVRLGRGDHSPVDARTAQHAGDDRANHSIHVGNTPCPDVTLFHRGGHHKQQENKPARSIQRQPNEGGGRESEGRRRSENSPPRSKTS